VTQRINGNSGSVLNGAIYAPSANVSILGGGSAAGGCMQVVARTVEFSGNAEVAIDCTGSGDRGIRAARRIALVE
jgi:hypothetical protein